MACPSQEGGGRWPGKMLLLGDWEGTPKAVFAELVVDLCPTAATDPIQVFTVKFRVLAAGAEGAVALPKHCSSRGSMVADRSFT